MAKSGSESKVKGEKTKLKNKTSAKGRKPVHQTYSHSAPF